MARHCSLWFMNSLRRWFRVNSVSLDRSPFQFLLSDQFSPDHEAVLRIRILHPSFTVQTPLIEALYLNEQHEFHWVKFTLKLASELSACSVSITCYKRVTSTNEAVWALVINWPLSEVPATRLLSGAIADSLSATILYTQWLYEPSPVSVDYPSNITNCHRMVGHSNARSIARDLWSFDALNVSLRTVIQLFDLLPPVPFSGAFRAPLRSASALSATFNWLPLEEHAWTSNFKDFEECSVSGPETLALEQKSKFSSFENPRFSKNFVGFFSNFPEVLNIYPLIFLADSLRKVFFLENEKQKLKKIKFYWSYTLFGLYSLNIHVQLGGWQTGIGTKKWESD